VLPIQPFEYAMKNKLDPMQHTIIKYTTRFREKNGKEDLLKAIHVLELLIEFEYGQDNTEKESDSGGLGRLEVSPEDSPFLPIFQGTEAELARLLKG